MLYNFAGDTLARSCKHKRQILFCLSGFFHALYNVQFSDKYENVLKDMCWNDAYLIIVLEDQYVVNCNNNTTHISKLTM